MSDALLSRACDALCPTRERLSIFRGSVRGFASGIEGLIDAMCDGLPKDRAAALLLQEVKALRLLEAALDREPLSDAALRQGVERRFTVVHGTGPSRVAEEVRLRERMDGRPR